MYVTHLECSLTGEKYPAGELHNLSRAGRPLLVRYDLDRVRGALDAETLASAPGRHVEVARIAADAGRCSRSSALASRRLR